MKTRLYRATIAVLLFLLMLMPGCAHYRQAIDEYRRAEPTPFYQKTMEWTTELSENAASSPESAVVDTSQRTPDLKEPKDRYEMVAAKVLGTTTEWVHDNVQTARDDSKFDRTLADRLEWDELILAVTVLNPGVKAARERWLATVYQYSQADFLEGLLREYSTFTRYLDVSPGKPLNKDMTQEYFPYPSTITLKGEIVREQVRLAELDWERTLRDALVNTGSTFFDYQFQYRGTAAVRENINILEDLVNVVQDRYSAGIASQADLLKAQTELERQKNLLKDFQSRLRSDAAQINAQLGRVANAPLGTPSDKDWTYAATALDTLTQTALDNRQEILAQQSRVARTEITIRLGEVMNRPLFTQGYSTLDRGMMAEASEGEPRPPYGVQPDAARLRPAYAQAESYLAEMRKRLQGEKETLDQVIAQTQALASTVLENLDIAHRQYVLIQQIVLPQDQSAYDIARSAYAASTVSFLDLLDAERSLVSSRLELYESRRDENQALLNLVTVRGFFRSFPG
ncbi:MAG: TolC family protein [Candidatus Hydrogenedentes bacterium]|nr:TolC family protein [Candidatus Hydrogenedentota bacterium]